MATRNRFGIGSICLALAVLAACSGKPATGETTSGGSGGGADPYSQYAPLEAGADYMKWTKVSKEPFLSPTHGGRFVEVYVNDVGLAAFKNDDAEIPDGTVIVKTSWEVENGKPTQVPGPIFVMAKKKGFNAERGDWWYALHWEKVPPNWVQRMGGATRVYWRSPSPRANYCWDCHENYAPRNLGGVPEEQRAW